MSNELFSTGGYNLEYFQVYNWGTFNGKIYTIKSNNKATLLTGENGSGKTTLVDALLTLLVPNDKRFYNQSSGEAKKRDRSEESYVLGAYGTKLADDENAEYSSVQYLRKRESTISILNGCFTNPFSQKSLSLLQIRYFTNSNLQQVFAITEGKLSIEEIYTSLEAQNVEIIRNKKWKETLTSLKGTLFYPSFKQYVSAYARVFGLRSDKALTLFSQIVGLKVLGDINSFIKYNMLEEGNIISEFDKLQDNYANLVHSYNEIQKTRVQIDKFQSVYENGMKYKEEQKRREQIKSMLETIPYWYMKNADIFLSSMLEANKEKKQKITDELEKTTQEIQSLEKEIESINHSIAQDSNKIRLMELDNKIKELNDKKRFRQDNCNLFTSYLNQLSIPFPESEKNFIDVRTKINDKQQKAINDESTVEEKIRLIRNEQDDISDSLNKIKAELESLNDRDNNIPDSNILIRKKLCQSLDVDEEEIPFAGELICVKESEQHWNHAIEKVLHNFALTLIVPESLFKAVSHYVNDNDLRGRIVYIKAEEDVFDIDNDEIEFNQDSLGNKLLFKSNHIQYRWIQKYVKQHFDYLCTDNIDKYAAYRKAVTSKGLIKSELKNEKDDRPEKNTKSNWVLGWNNRDKKALLSKDYDEMSNELNQLSTEETKTRELKNNLRNIQNLCRDAQLIEKWEKIDVESIIKQIDELETNRESLLSENSSLAKLENELLEKKKLKSLKDDFAQNLNKNIGGLDEKISEIESDLKSNTAHLNILQQQFDSSLFEEKINSLQEAYPRLSRPKDFDELKKNRDTIESELKSKDAGSGRALGGYESTVRNAMEEALHPKSKLILDKYGDWSLEFPDLRSTLEYLDDFISTYKKLENDDLPKYTKRFHDYLHTSLNEDFTGFQRSIQNQQQEIKQAITSLNQDLRRIAYNKNPDTYLQLEWRTKNDTDIKDFKKLLDDAKPDAMLFAENNPQKEEEQFSKIQKLLKTLNEDERFKRKVLDVRNWFQYGAQELYSQDNTQKQYYSDSSSLSGGQKTKLTYTILAAAISYQFGIAANVENNSSFRFVIIDEAFSKIDTKNSEQVMAIFNDLDIQVMVVTPNDKINVVEDYISSIHIVDKSNTNDSRLIYMSIEEYKEKAK